MVVELLAQASLEAVAIRTRHRDLLEIIHFPKPNDLQITRRRRASSSASTSRRAVAAAVDADFLDVNENHFPKRYLCCR